MKKHELLKYAYDNYPKGTKVKSLYDDSISISSGVFVLSTNIWCDLNDCKKDFDVYDMASQKWAEIITEQSHTLKVSGAKKTSSFEVSETEIRLNVNSQKMVFTNDFLEKHLLPAVKAYKKLKKIKS